MFILTCLSLCACTGKQPRDIGGRSNNDVETSDVVDDNKQNLTKKYSDGIFSISYPEDWTVVEKPDMMTNVYIGSEKLNLGFTVLHFETDETFDEIMKEGNASVAQSGQTIASEDEIKINNLKGYRQVIVFSYGDKDYEQISYTFKKNRMFYNIRFGSDPQIMKSNTNTINNIINSFKIK